MSHRKLIAGASLAALTLLLGFTLACDSSTPDDAQTEAASAADVKQEAQDLLATTKDYGRGQKQILERQAQETLDDLNAGIQELQSNMNDTSEDAKAELERALERAEQARDNIVTEVDDMKDATQDRWEQTTRRLSAAVEEAREARREIGRALTGEEANPEAG